MKFSRVLFCTLAFVSCIFVSPFKKTSSRFLLSFFSFTVCSAFPASNSLQILVRSYLSSELRWQVFSLWWNRFHRFVIFGRTETFRCYRSIQLGATDFTTGKTACHSCVLLIQLHSMNLVLYQHHIFLAALTCDSRTKPMWQHIQKILLGNWCQRGRERSHQKLYL